MASTPPAPGSFGRFRQIRVRVIGITFGAFALVAAGTAVLTERWPLLATATLLVVACLALVRLSHDLPDADAPASENTTALALMGVAFVSVIAAAVVAGLSAGG